MIDNRLGILSELSGSSQDRGKAFSTYPRLTLNMTRSRFFGTSDSEVIFINTLTAKQYTGSHGYKCEDYLAGSMTVMKFRALYLGTVGIIWKKKSRD
jgi:hypothetical protein